MIKIHSKKDTHGFKYHWFTICGWNNKIFATSETYKTKSGCAKAAKDCRKLMWSTNVLIHVDGKVL